MKVKKVLVSAFLLATCLMNVQAQRRNEIQIPDLDGYTTLKCDFHMHTVFSDGLVWPTVRVDEAYREGLDAISLTEHIEYRPHKKDVVADHNRSFDLCQKQAEKLAEKTMDISADLQELANTPVCVVCAGAKSILDLGLTLEYLETQGVPVLGLRTDELPAFYCRTSGFKLDYNCKDEETVAKIMKAKWDIGLKGGAVVGNPIPEQYAMDPNYMNGIIDKAVAQANAEHIHGKAITPYLLAHIKDMTEGKSFAANLELAYNNAHAASKIAVAYSKL